MNEDRIQIYSGFCTNCNLKYQDGIAVVYAKTSKGKVLWWHFKGCPKQPIT